MMCPFSRTNARGLMVAAALQNSYLISIPGDQRAGISHSLPVSDVFITNNNITN